MPFKTKADVHGSRHVTLTLVTSHIARGDPKKRLDAAQEWLLRLESAERIDEVWPDFEKWLAEDPRNRKAFLQLEKASRRLDRLGELRPPGEEVNPDLLSVAARKSQSPEHESIAIRMAWIGVAAAIVASLLPLSYRWWQSHSWRSYETAVGSHQVYGLPDGSSIELNTNSELRVRLTKASRDIVLVRGEVVFNVRYDPRRPLVLSVGNTTITDIGTTFDVRRRPDDSIEVFVKSGRVVIADDTVNSGRRTTLSEGEVAHVSLRGTSVEHLGEETIKRRLSWQNGTLSFAGETLAEAVEEINRYNRTQIVIDDPQVAKIRLGGVFPAKNPEAFVDALAYVLGVRYTSVPSPGGGVIRLRGGRP
jgi:transmembrane sensor